MEIKDKVGFVQHS